MAHESYRRLEQGQISMTKLWSHEAAQRTGLPDRQQAELWLRAMGRRPEEISEADLPKVIQRCRDEQEALSRRYGAGTLLVLPLASGNIAIFGLDRQLLDVVNPLEPPNNLLYKLHELSAEDLAAAQARSAPQAGQASSVDLSETGL